MRNMLTVLTVLVTEDEDAVTVVVIDLDLIVQHLMHFHVPTVRIWTKWKAWNMHVYCKRKINHDIFSDIINSMSKMNPLRINVTSYWPNVWMCIWYLFFPIFQGVKSRSIDVVPWYWRTFDFNFRFECPLGFLPISQVLFNAPVTCGWILMNAFLFIRLWWYTCTWE